MRAAFITEFGEPLEITDTSDPALPVSGVVVRVEATGICRSDWHAWMGHERLIGLPHVPGHEMAGRIESVGADVTKFAIGDRVTVPFSMGCGTCRSCRVGHTNTCDRPFTPGFTHWGSFAELVALEHADVNLVRLPDDIGATDAAALGCRFVTAFRAVVDRGQTAPGEWLAVYGCGGVGLSAVMIGSAIGARVVAVDVSAESLALAAELGASATVDASAAKPVEVVRDVTGGGAHVSIDAVGSSTTALDSIASLRKHGRHVQVGLMYGADSAPPIPMEPIIMNELVIIGSRGMSASDYPRVLDLVALGGVELGRLVTRTVALDEASNVLATMGAFSGVGVTVIDRF